MWSIMQLLQTHMSLDKYQAYYRSSITQVKLKSVLSNYAKLAYNQIHTHILQLHMPNCNVHIYN
jgi:hypothetical protein